MSSKVHSAGCVSPRVYVETCPNLAASGYHVPKIRYLAWLTFVSTMFSRPGWWWCFTIVVLAIALLDSPTCLRILSSPGRSGPPFTPEISCTWEKAMGGLAR
jgi:hypothetical protein